MSKKLIVAIDGPAGSGKSTSAKLVAQKLNFLYIDTGAMYRAVTYLAIKNNVLNNNDKLIELAENIDIDLEFINGNTKVYVDGNDITDNIRTYEVNVEVSNVSKVEGVRKSLVKKQKELGSQNRSVVMEGRDIGTVVFPEADLKFFLTADIEQRAKRRAKEYEDIGNNIPIEDIKENLKQRDQIDSTRVISPLVKSPDAIEIDTSNVTIQHQVDIILEQVKRVARKKKLKLKIE